ncbi:hypothetical protein [Haladaptatus sp. NG-SE-30]
MNRRRLLIHVTAFLSALLAGCSNVVSFNDSSSAKSEPTLQEVVVKNHLNEKMTCSLEIVRNMGAGPHRLHFDLHEIEPDESESYSRDWTEKAGHFSVVLHCPSISRYELVTFSTSERMPSDATVRVIFTVEEDQIRRAIDVRGASK